MPLPPKFYTIVSNGMAYELDNLTDYIKFPYSKYFIKRLHSINTDKSGEFIYIFIDKEGKSIDMKIKEIQIQSVRWNKRRWIVTLIDHRDQGYENFIVEDAPNFPELNIFSDLIFPKINEIMSYENVGYYIINKRLKDLSDRIEKLEKLKN